MPGIQLLAGFVALVAGSSLLVLGLVALLDALYLTHLDRDEGRPLAERIAGPLRAALPRLAGGALLMGLAAWLLRWFGG